MLKGLAIFVSMVTGLAYLPARAVAEKALRQPAIPIDQIAHEVKTEKQKLQEQEQQKRSVLGELYSVNRDLKKINSERSRIERGYKTAGENVQALSLLISQLDIRITKQRSRLRGRLKALSKVQGQGVARLIFGSRSSGELDSNLRVFRIVTEKDVRLLKNFKENLRVFASQKSKLDSQEKKYSKLKRSLDQKQAALSHQLDKKNAMIKTIDTERILHIAKLKRLRLQSSDSVANDKELDKIRALEELFRQQLFEKKGELPAPVAGRVSRSFGVIQDEDSNTKIRFKGSLYEVKAGVAIKSVFNGVIAFSGWLDGYGKTVIVDHGDHYFTVYANNSTLEVKEGQAVGEGQTLGFSGEGESFLGKGVYFELRHFSEPEDPKDWLKGRQTT